MANTRDVMGDQACLDALVADEIVTFEDDDITNLASNRLYYSSTLRDVVLPNVTSIQSSSLSYNSVLETVDFGKRVQFYSDLGSCPNLKHVILRGDTMSGVTNGVTMFTNSGIGIGEGAVYVPSNLVSTYKAYTSWNKFLVLPISEYPATDFSTIRESWDDIITACGNGTYSSNYNIGDTKSIEIDGTTYYMQLVAKDADVLASDGTTTVPTTWFMLKKLYATKHDMRSDNSASNGWANSEMRSWLANDVLPLFPSNVRGAIKEVRKYTGYDNTKNNVTADKLWIPSYYEINAGNSFEDAGMTFSTTLYPNSPSSSARIARVKWDQSSTASNWWLRSNESSLYRSVDSTGDLKTSAPRTTYGVAFGFCI